MTFTISVASSREYWYHNINTMKLRIQLFIIILSNWSGIMYANPIQVSEALKLIPLNEQVYIHTENDNNGIVYINNKKAVIVSTPENDIETDNLINYIRNVLKADIVACVIDPYHSKRERLTHTGKGI